MQPIFPTRKCALSLIAVDFHACALVRVTNLRRAPCDRKIKHRGFQDVGLRDFKVEQKRLGFYFFFYPAPSFSYLCIKLLVLSSLLSSISDLCCNLS